MLKTCNKVEKNGNAIREIKSKAGECMAETTIYLIAKQHVVAQNDEILLGDAADLFCENEVICAKAKAMRIHKFHKGQDNREIISIVKVIEQLTKLCPGCSVESLGETDMIIERDVTIKKRNQDKLWKIILVSLICFFGTAFTIMGFHNDIQINDVFARIHEIVTGETTDGFTALEVSYSIGLMAGIIAFYNHVGGKKLSKDPTPLEVEMRNYERDVNQALVEMADREGKEKV